MLEQQKRVSVAVRVRPVLRNGISHGHQQEKFELEATSRISDTQIKVEQKRQDEACRSSVFSFDYIFDQESTQLEVYEESALELVDAALIGVNATILAYGQTGSGKTHTVLGEVKHNPLENDLLTHNSGLFLRVLNDLMEYKSRRAAEMHVIVGLSCVEIYNDSIRDLFGGSPNEQPPTLRAVMVGDDVYLPSLIVKEVTSLSAVFSEIQLAISRRQSRSTDLNSASSRSHCLFMIDILQSPVTAPKPSLSLLDTQRQPGTGDEPRVGRTRGQTIVDASKREGKSGTRNRGQTVAGQPVSGSATPTASPTTPQAEIPFLGTIFTVPGQVEPVWASKILLADLAGSERIKQSGVVGDGLAEATAINSSLTALGKVVHSLHEGTYVSYRSSNLTTLLKPTFCHPSSRVLLLAQVSPTQMTFDETTNTLHFASRVKDMKVTTTTGAEAEKLQFDVIEAEKTYDALLADLHICAAETGCGPVIKRVLAKKGKGPQLFYDAKARRSYKKDERRQVLEQLGMFEVAVAERDVQVKRRIDEEANEQHRLQHLLKKEEEALIQSYREQRGDAEREIATTHADATSHLLKQLILDNSAMVAVISVEEDVSFLAIEASHYEGLKKIGASELHGLNTEFQSLASSKPAKQSSQSLFVDPTADADAQASAVEDDRHYAMGVWGHCAAKRFFTSVMELRESQWRWNLAKTQVAGLSTWLAKANNAEKKGVQ